MKALQNFKLASYLKAMGDDNRLAIMNLLKQGPLCVCEIFPALDLPQNLASHHLKVLRECGLVESRRDGVKIIYSRKKAAIERCRRLLIKAI